MKFSLSLRSSLVHSLATMIVATLVVACSQSQELMDDFSRQPVQQVGTEGEQLNTAQRWWVQQVEMLNAEIHVHNIHGQNECGDCEAKVPHALMRNGELAQRAKRAVERDGLEQVWPQIVCGMPTDAFPAVVAIYQAIGNGVELGNLIGTGTLAEDRRSILTAEHVVDRIRRPGSVVVFSSEPRQSALDRRVRSTGDPRRHRDLGHNIKLDLAVLTLDADAPGDIAPLKLGGKDLVVEGDRVRAVGYGFDEHRGKDLSKTVQIIVASAPCDSRKGYGCEANVEFVASEPFAGCDTCDYDSGGPALVATPGGLRIVGVLRAAAKVNNPNECERVRTKCGCGSIYVYADHARAILTK